MTDRLFLPLVALLGLTAYLSYTLSHASAPPVERWSETATWQGHVPQAGEAVVIPRGKTVLLDTNTPLLGGLDIQGTLLFDRANLRLRSRTITLTGRLAVGEAGRPFLQQADIVLGSPESVRARADQGDGLLMVGEGGKLEVWGEPRSHWLHLAQTAQAGSRRLRLESAVNWPVGSRLVLAPSHFEAHEAETPEVAALEDGGKTLWLTKLLRYEHYGKVTQGVDERAEVGLLSHNIVIEGTPQGLSSGLGGGIMVMQGGKVQVSNAEFRGLGRSGQLGFYPIHFHHAGDQSASTVQGSSIHDVYNRCLTLHSTNGAQILDNVTYNTQGHCFFMEDGSERGNVLRGNLAVLTQAATGKAAILDTDPFASSFWISNPDNVIENNVAAGAAHSGFWYQLLPHPVGDGLSAQAQKLQPRRTDLGSFKGNVAHSNGFNGLFVDNLQNPPGVTEAPNYSPPQLADFATFTAYKNRRRGVWLRGIGLLLSDPKLADNAIGVTFAAAQASVRGGVIVGQSDNISGPPKPAEPHFPIRGFEFYDGPVSVQGTHFVNFWPTQERQAGALGLLQYSPFFFHPASTASGLSFEHAQPVYMAPRQLPSGEDSGADGYRSGAFVDTDGSITGSAGASVVLDTPFLRREGCTSRPEWGAAVCTGQLGSLFVSNMDKAASPLSPLTVQRSDGAVMVLRGNPRPGPNRSFQTNLWPECYTLSSAQPWPEHLRLSLHHWPPNQALDLALPGYAQAPQVSAGVTHEWQAGVLHLHLEPTGEALRVDVSKSP